MYFIVFFLRYINGKLVYSSRADETDEIVISSFDGVELVVDVERGTSTLTVLSSTVDSEAQYTCRLHNACGSAFTNAHLFVLGRCLIFFTTWPILCHTTSYYIIMFF